MRFLKEYEIPTVTVIALTADDVLTASQGFDGEDHELFATDSTEA